MALHNMILQLGSLCLLIYCRIAQARKKTNKKQTNKQTTKNVLPLTLLTLNFSGYPTVFISILDKHCQNPDLVLYNQGKNKKKGFVYFATLFLLRMLAEREPFQWSCFAIIKIMFYI